jgi:hypothetical protein
MRQIHNLSVAYAETLEPERRLGDGVVHDRRDAPATLVVLGDDRVRKGQCRRVIRSVSASMVLVILAAIWVVWFRPQVLGGSASYVEATTPAMTPAIVQGDIAVVRTQARYHLGDVIAYRRPATRTGAKTEVLGRIAYANPAFGFVVKGDDLPAPDAFHPRGADVVGRVWLHFGRSLLLPLCLVAAAVFVVLMAAAWPGNLARRHPDRGLIEANGRDIRRPAP